MVNQLEMVGFIKTNGTGCRFVSIVTDTPVKNLRAACPFKNVRKVSRKIGLLNANYNTSVRRRIAEKLGVELKEVEYQNGEVWYQHVMTADGKALPLVVNKKTPDSGKYYLQYFPHKAENKFVAENGDILTEAQLEPYFYASKREDFKPCVIAVSVENIMELKASGIIIQMPDFEQAEALLNA